MQTAGKAPSVRAMENRIAELEHRLTEAAAFLERMADRFLGLSASDDAIEAAADCRAMAKRLRGET